MKKILMMLLIIAMSVAMGCGGKEVRRGDASESSDLSGRWNAKDSQLVSEEMIQDVLNRPWLGKFKSKHGGKVPTVIVGTIRNRSSEHINVQTFTKDLERSLINSGEVDFVASSSERDEIRDERLDQASSAREDTAKEHGMEIGADYMLKGSINSIKDKQGGKSEMYYQINMELIDLESNRKVWMGDKKIFKKIKQKRFGF